jgi:hypothetical protein
MLKILVVTGALCVAVAPAYGQTITQIGDQVMAEYSGELGESSMIAAADDLDLPLGNLGNIYEYKNLSPGKAFVLSLVLPGAGQYYTGNKIKAAVSLAIESALWLGRFSYRSQGDDQVLEYEAFADDHWSDIPYFNSLLAEYEIDRWGDSDPGVPWAHHLPFKVDGVDTTADMNHEYYENIGKYDQFVWGWDDLVPISDTLPIPENNYRSPTNRPKYLLMRESANKSFDRARKATILVIANHLLSAFDAALSAQRQNRSAMHSRKLDVSVQVVQIRETPTPWVTVAYQF